MSYINFLPLLYLLSIKLGHRSMYKYVVLVLVLYFLKALDLSAQDQFLGIVTDTTKHIIKNAQVVLQSDSNVVAVYNTKETGTFTINGVSPQRYEVVISCMGYKTLREKITVGSDGFEFFTLKEDTLNLKGVTVSASRPSQSTATGHIYYLSAKAKNSYNPFTALKEIPGMVSDDVNNTIKSADGKGLLILIDGVKVNSGIAPISPSQIESVEVQDVIEAKYIGGNIGKILNIHLKSDAGTYTFVESDIRNDMPTYGGNVGIQFEVGSPKLSLFGSVTPSYTHNNSTDGNMESQSADFTRTEMTDIKVGSRKVDYSALLKYKASDNDNLAVYFQGGIERLKLNSCGDGSFANASGNESYSNSSRQKQLSRILTGTLYYKHTFNSKADIETYLAYSHNFNNLYNNVSQWYGNDGWHDLYDYDTRRNRFSQTTDYVWRINSKMNFSVGNSTEYVRENVGQNDSHGVDFLHRQVEEYVYMGLSGSLNRLKYTLSGGIDGVWSWSDKIFNRYFCPRVSASVGYDLKKYGSLLLSYKIDDKKPSISMLNPYVTTIDSIRISYGNPLLTPQTNHTIGLQYSINFKNRFYVTARTDYTLTKDIINDYAFMDKGVFNKTFINNGYYHFLSASLMTMYNGRNLNVLLHASHNVCYFMEQPAKKYFQLVGSCSYDIGKFNVSAMVVYMNYDYTSISRTRYDRPVSSTFSLTYRFSRQAQLTLGLEDWMGNVRIKTLTESDGYQMRTSSEAKTFRPFVSFKWTLRKNDKRKIDMNNNIMRRREKALDMRVKE